MTMISATHVNTAATFPWTLLHLLQNPSHLATLRSEITAHPPSTHHVYPYRAMPFAEACLRETGRLYTNLLMLRFLPNDVVAPGGRLIPRGWVAISPLATQQDPLIFEHPQQWNPERFLYGSYASMFRSNGFVQFGAGAHACLGEKFTYSLLRGVLWPMLMDGYEVELVNGTTAGEGVDGVGVAPNYRENLGTPFGVREVHIRVVRRQERLSEQV